MGPRVGGVGGGGGEGRRRRRGGRWRGCGGGGGGGGGVEEVEEVCSTGCMEAAVVGGGRTMRGRRALARGACDLALDASRSRRCSRVGLGIRGEARQARRGEARRGGWLLCA